MTDFYRLNNFIIDVLVDTMIAQYINVMKQKLFLIPQNTLQS